MLTLYKAMTFDQLSTLVREVVGEIDRGNVRSCESAVKRLRDVGLTANLHMRSNLSAREILEWYAGQIIETVNVEAWFAMNSIINCCEKFTGGTPL